MHCEGWMVERMGKVTNGTMINPEDLVANRVHTMYGHNNVLWVGMAYWWVRWRHDRYPL